MERFKILMIALIVSMISVGCTKEDIDYTSKEKTQLNVRCYFSERMGKWLFVYKSLDADENDHWLHSDPNDFDDCGLRSGYIYTVLVWKYKLRIWPMDGSDIQYRYIRTLSKKKESTSLTDDDVEQFGGIEGVFRRQREQETN